MDVIFVYILFLYTGGIFYYYNIINYNLNYSRLFSLRQKIFKK